MLAPNVKIIEPTKKVDKTYNGMMQDLPKRVCGYCRVSTNSEEQKTSYESQKIYYENLIRGRQNWIFAGIYADEGITGTSMRKRDDFNKMIKAALNGEIDIILVKSVARFARNVVDILTIIEQLTLKGVAVIFENEHLNSLDDQKTTKMQLMLCAANAEDYSQTLSESVKWGKIRQIEQGNYPFSKCYGYIIEIRKQTIDGKERVVEKTIKINEREAETVRLIFNQYLNGYSYRQIAIMLEERGIESPRGKEKWKASTVQGILQNEKYKGDLHLQKQTYSDIKFRKRIPNTEGKQYYIEDHHKAIISKSEWNRVAKEIEFRNNQRGYGETGRSVYTSKYPFSNKIYCLQCGSKFRRYNYETKQGKVATWVCINHKNKNSTCTQLQIIESRIESAFVETLNELITDKENVINTVLDNIESVIRKRKEETTPEQIDDQIAIKQRELMTLIQGINTMDTYNESQRIMNEIENLKAQKEDIIKTYKQRERDIHRTEDLRRLINERTIFDKFQPHIFKQLVDKILIDGDKAIFVFSNMMKVTKIVK